MEEKLIDKCLDFAEGKKGKFTILMAKKPNFPNSLIDGTEKQRLINEYVQQGLNTFQIADKMGCTQPNVVEHMRQYKKSAAFYCEWCMFWEFAADARQMSIAVVFEDILTEREIKEYEGKNIKTVGDFLCLAVTMKSGRMCDKLNGLDAKRKGEMFDRIRKICYQLNNA